MVFPLVIIDDFDVRRPACCPSETHTNLIVDANAMLPFALAFERFQAIVGRDEQIVQRAGAIEHGQLAHGDGFDIHETAHTHTMEQGLGFLATKGSYRHAT